MRSGTINEIKHTFWLSRVIDTKAQPPSNALNTIDEPLHLRLFIEEYMTMNNTYKSGGARVLFFKPVDYDNQLALSNSHNKLNNISYLDLGVHCREIGRLASDSATVLLLHILLSAQNYSRRSLFFIHGDLDKELTRNESVLDEDIYTEQRTRTCASISMGQSVSVFR
jgi:hypothetical protein